MPGNKQSRSPALLMSAPSHKKGCTKSICVRGCTVEAARQLLLTGKRKQLDHGKKKENKKRRKKEDKDDEDGEEQEEEQEEEQGSEENSRRLLHAPSTLTRDNEKSKPAMRKANQLFRYFLSKFFFFVLFFMVYLHDGDVYGP